MFHVSTMLPYSRENKQQVRMNTDSLRAREPSNSDLNVEKYHYGFMELETTYVPMWAELQAPR